MTKVLVAGFLWSVSREDNMSLAFPSLGASTINVSAYLTPSETAKSSIVSRVAYTVSLSSAAASIVAAVDMLGIALLGTGTPWVFLPALWVFYLSSGVMLGGFISLVWIVLGRGKRQPTSHSHFTILMQRTIHGSLLAIFAVVTLERLLGGNVGQADLSAHGRLVLLAIGYITALIAFVFWATNHSTKTETHGISISQIAVITASFVWWTPFNKIHDVAMLSVTSLLWNSFYIVGWFIGYRAVSHLVRQSTLRKSLDSTRLCLRSTGLFTMIGLTLSSTAWAFNRPTPIDLSPSSQLQNTIATSSTDKPNVVLIVMDTTRADHLSCYGYPKNTTPVLSALARESVIYRHAVSPSPWTLPAHASMFTGLYPIQHNAYCHPSNESKCQAYPLPPERQTVAERLSAQGYDTAAVLGNWSILHRSFGLDQGFWYYDDRPRLAINSTVPNTLSPARWLSGAWQLLQGHGRPSRSASEVNDSALAWLNRPRTKPFFLMLNYLDPHQPYQSHPEFKDQLASAPSQPLIATKVAKPRSPIRPNLENDISRYDQELAFVDAQIGLLLDTLRAKGLYESSLIIVTSDHGEAFDEHGYLGHSNTVYEEEVHVPLIVRYPHGSRQGVVTNTTSLIDVAHLIMQATGYTLLNHDALVQIDKEQNGHQKDQQALVFSQRFRWLPKTDPLYGPTTSAVYLSEGLKVILYETDKIKTRAYDLIADPLEQDDIADQQSNLVEQASSRLEAWFDKLRTRQFVDSELTRNTQLTENLKTLGYVGD